MKLGFICEGQNNTLKLFILNEMNSRQILGEFTRFSNGKNVNQVRIVIKIKSNEIWFY